MPRQKRTVEVDSSRVQGEGSWVRISKMTWGEIKAMRAKSKEAEGDDDEEGDADLAFEMGEETIVKHVIGWNWADEDEKPLPQPQDDPAVFDTLTDDEFGFLAEAIAGSEEVRKN